MYGMRAARNAGQRPPQPWVIGNHASAASVPAPPTASSEPTIVRRTAGSTASSPPRARAASTRNGTTAVWLTACTLVTTKVASASARNRASLQADAPNLQAITIGTATAGACPAIDAAVTRPIRPAPDRAGKGLTAPPGGGRAVEALVAPRR